MNSTIALSACDWVVTNDTFLVFSLDLAKSVSRLLPAIVLPSSPSRISFSSHEGCIVLSHCVDYESWLPNSKRLARRTIALSSLDIGLAPSEFEHEVTAGAVLCPFVALA